MSHRRQIDPRGVRTPVMRSCRRVRSSDYPEAENLGFWALLVLTLTIAGLGLYRVLTGSPFPGG